MRDHGFRKAVEEFDSVPYRIVQEALSPYSDLLGQLYRWWLYDDEEIPVSFISAYHYPGQHYWEILSTETRRDRVRMGYHKALRAAVEGYIGDTLLSTTSFSTEGLEVFKSVGGTLVDDGNNIKIDMLRGCTPMPFVLSWTHHLVYELDAYEEYSEEIDELMIPEFVKLKENFDYSGGQEFSLT